MQVSFRDALTSISVSWALINDYPYCVEWLAGKAFADLGHLDTLVIPARQCAPRCLPYFCGTQAHAAA